RRPWCATSVPAPPRWRVCAALGPELAALDAGGEHPAVDDLPGAVDARVVGQDHPHRAKEGLRQIEPPEPPGELDLIGCDWVALEPRQRAPLRARYEPARHTVRRRAAVRGAEH